MLSFIANLRDLRLTHPIESPITTERRSLYSASNLDDLDVWFGSLEIVIAFECQKISSNCILDPLEILYCKPKIDRLISSGKSTNLVCAIIAQFSKLIDEGVGIEENTGQEAIDICFDQAVDFASIYEPLLDESLFHCRHVSVTPTSLFLEGPFVDE